MLYLLMMSLLVTLNRINSLYIRTSKCSHISLHRSNNRLSLVAINDNEIRSLTTSDINRHGQDPNFAAKWQANGKIYVSNEKLEKLNKLLSYTSKNKNKKDKVDLLRELSLTYFARFHNLIRQEYQFEKKMVEERIKTWGNSKLKKEGMTLFDMKPTFRGALFQDQIVRFDLGKGQNLPFNRFALGDSVRLTLRGDNPLATGEGDVIDGMVLQKGSKYIDLCVRSVDLALIERGRKYRLDCAVNRVSYDRMLESLQLFLRSDDSNNIVKVNRALRDLMLYSYPNALTRLSLGSGGLRLGLPVNEKELIAIIKKQYATELENFTIPPPIEDNEDEEIISLSSSSSSAPKALTVSEALQQSRGMSDNSNNPFNNPFASGNSVSSSSLEQQQQLYEKKKQQLLNISEDNFLLPFLGVFKTNQRLNKMTQNDLYSENFDTRAFDIREIEAALDVVQSRGKRDLDAIYTEYMNESPSMNKEHWDFLHTVTDGQPEDSLQEQIELQQQLQQQQQQQKQVPKKKPVNLNKSQRRSLFNSISKPLSLIQGPPGTGKTATACTILATLIELRNERLRSGGKRSQGFKSYKALACAHSNVATDNLLRGLLELGVNAVRIGRPSSVQVSLWAHTLDAKLQEEPLYLAAKMKVDEARSILDEERQYGGQTTEASRGRLTFALKRLNKVEKAAGLSVLKNADVVVSTCIGSGSELMRLFTDNEEAHFSTVLIDEAAQCVESAVLPTLLHGCDQLILVGDQNQLPPVVLSPTAADEGLGVSLFARLVAGGLEPNLLQEQYRMHEEIAEFSSKYFYNNELKTSVNKEDRPRPEGFHWPHINSPVAFLDVGGEAVGKAINPNNHEILKLEQTGSASDTSYYNLVEAEIVVNTIHKLLDNTDLKLSDIGVISPYNAQVRKLTEIFIQEGWMESTYESTTKGKATQELLESKEKLAQELEVRSVDGFQGREKEVIIITTVRSNIDRKLGFLSDWRRLNVGITRAKRGLIVIGDSRTLESDKNWNNFLKWCDHKNVIQVLDGENELLSSYIDKACLDDWDIENTTNIVN